MIHLLKTFFIVDLPATGTQQRNGLLGLYLVTSITPGYRTFLLLIRRWQIELAEYLLKGLLELVVKRQPLISRPGPTLIQIRTVRDTKRIRLLQFHGLSLRIDQHPLPVKPMPFPVAQA